MIEIWQQNVQRIRDRKVFWGRLDSELREYDWDKLIDMVDSHPRDDYDWNREKQRLGLNVFIREGLHLNLHIQYR